MEINKVLILGFATWRLTSLLNNENGPKDVFKIFRSALSLRPFNELTPTEKSKYYTENIVPHEPIYIHDGNLFAQIVECHWCLSIWVAFVLSLLSAITKQTKWRNVFITTLAASAISIQIDNLGE